MNSFFMALNSWSRFLVLMSLSSAFLAINSGCGVRVGNPAQSGTGKPGTEEKRHEEKSHNDTDHKTETDLPLPTNESSQASNEGTMDLPTAGAPLPPNKGRLQAPTALVGLKFSFEGQHPSQVKNLFLKAQGIALSVEGAEDHTIGLPVPVTFDLLTPGGASLPARELPAGKWLRVTLTLSAPPCYGVGVDTSGTTWKCRIGSGQLQLHFTPSPESAEITEGQTKTMHLRFAGSQVLWNATGFDNTFPADANTAGFKIILPANAGTGSFEPH